MALNEAVNELKEAVTGLADRIQDLSGPLQFRIEELETALDLERAAFADYRAAEDAEDVEQEEALAAARAETDARIAEANEAIVGINAAVEEIRKIGSTEEDPLDPEEPAEEPVEGDEPVVEEPVVDEPVVEPVEDEPVDNAPVDETPADPEV